MKWIGALALSLGCLSGIPSCEKAPILVESNDERAPQHWRGVVFGIHMQAQFHGLSQHSFERIGVEIERVAQEYERAFSLYSDTSELSILNMKRRLGSPTPLFRDLCLRSKQLNDQSLGYFAPSVENVWGLISSGNTTESSIAAAHSGSSMGHLEFVGQAIELTHPQTRLSFNALVQGAFADAVGELASRHGVECALLQLGETVAIGEHPSGRPWSLAIESSDVSGQLIDVLTLSDSAMAISAQATGILGFDPVAGEVRERELVVAVDSVAGAAVADAFATAFLSAPRERWPELFDALLELGKARVVLWQDGERLQYFE